MDNDSFRGYLITILKNMHMPEEEIEKALHLSFDILNLITESEAKKLYEDFRG